MKGSEIGYKSFEKLSKKMTIQSHL